MSISRVQLEDIGPTLAKDVRPNDYVAVFLRSDYTTDKNLYRISLLCSNVPLRHEEDSWFGRLPYTLVRVISVTQHASGRLLELVTFSGSQLVEYSERLRVFRQKL